MIFMYKQSENCIKKGNIYTLFEVERNGEMNFNFLSDCLL